MSKQQRWLMFWKLLNMKPANAVASALGITRQALHNLKTLQHANIPIDLLRKLARIANSKGMIDGSRPPTADALVRIWGEAKGGSWKL